MALFRSLIRRAAPSAAPSVPDVMVSFGTRSEKLTFVSHPGVMAIAKLLEMRHISRPRAILTQDNVDAIMEFDEVLATKAQIAMDNKLHINFLELEHIEQPGYLETLLREKSIIETARQEVLSAPKGNYKMPKILDEYSRPEAPRAWRPELEITQDIIDVQPGIREDMELNALAKSHVQKQIEAETGKPFISSKENLKISK